MATSFPGNLDDFAPNPAPTDPRNAPSLAGKITNLSDAMEAVEAKVGTTASAVTSSLDYKTTANVYLTGSGVPGAGLGANGNLYLNTATGIVYAKAAGAWSAVYTPSSGAARAASVLPEDMGFTAWNGAVEPFNVAANFANAATLYVEKVWINAGTVTNCHLSLGNPATLTQAYMALYTGAGALLSQSANLAATYTGATGLATFPLAAPQVVASGNYYVAFWSNANGLNPYHSATFTTSGANGRLGAGAYRTASANTGLTTAAPATIGTMTAIGTSFWVAVS